MKTAMKLLFTTVSLSALAAPTLSQAAYFVDQTKTWAVTGQTNVMGKKIHANRALDAMAYVPADSSFGNEYFQKGGIINQH